MDKKICYILGTIFIITGGFIYTTERALSYFVWIGQMNAALHVGNYPSSPQLPVFFTNLFIPIFIVVGIIFFLAGYKRANCKIQKNE